MAQTSFYDVLLVDQNATFDEIKLAFKRRALQVHPDKGGSKEEFHLVYQALETLGDPAARQEYDHSLETTKTGAEPHAPYPKGKKRKREGKQAQPAASCKAEMKTKPQKTPGKKSTTFPGKAASKPSRATPTSAEPQSKQTKLLMKIRDLLKQLPRDARNDVITNQFSQKQRVILERFVVDNANTSSGANCHSEAEALAPAAASERHATNQAGYDIEAVSKATSQSTSTHGSNLLALPTTNCSVAMAKSTEKKRKSKKRVRSSLGAICNKPHGVATSVTMQASNAQVSAGEAADTGVRPYPKGMEESKGHAGCYPLKSLAVPNSEIADSKYKLYMARAKKPAGVRVQDQKEGINTKARSYTGSVMRSSSSSYCARICFDSLVMRTGNCDLKTALDYLVILTSVKQKMRDQKGTGTFVERLQAALASCAAEHGRNLADLKLGFRVFQRAGCFIGSPLMSPSVHSVELLGKMHSVLEPFRQYFNHMGCQSVYWRFSPVHLEDAWGRFQLAVAEVWETTGADSKAILRKIHSLYEAQAPFRSASLQRWERGHMAMCDKNKHRPKNLRERNPTGRLQRWERRQMACEDKNKHRSKNLSRLLTALGKLIARWGQMLERESKLVDQQRQRVLRQQKAQQKKDQEERRRVEVLKQKRRQEEERLRREWIRKRMRTDLTMDDILGQNSVRNIPKSSIASTVGQASFPPVPTFCNGSVVSGFYAKVLVCSMLAWPVQIWL